MAYGLPAKGQADYDDELNNSIEAVRSEAALAQSTADGANTSANAAKTDATNAVATANQALDFVRATSDDRVAEHVNDAASATTAALGGLYAAKSHETATTDAHDASAISVVPTGTVTATDVQAALAELDTEKQARADSLTVLAAGLAPVLGSPVIATVNRVAMYLLDPASTEDVGGAVTIPDHWATAHADVWWANTSTGTGDVTFRFDIGPVTEGAAAPDPAAGSQLAIVAAGQNVMKKSRIATGVAVTPGFAAFEVIRLAADGTDTLASDIGVFAVVLTRAS